MGGRGSLSQKKHPNTYDKESIRKLLSDNGIKLVGNYKAVNNRNLSLVADIAETVTHLNKEFGKRIDHIYVGSNRKSDLAFSGKHEVLDVLGNIHTFQNTLLIPTKTLNKGRSKFTNEIKQASKQNKVVSNSLRQAVMHEYGHALHLALGKQNLNLYKELERRFSYMIKDEGTRIHLSSYATNKAYKGRVSSKEYIAESVVHLLRGTNPPKGRDMVELTHYYLSQVKGVNFDNYASKYLRNQNRTKIKRKRGTSARKTSGRTR